MGRKYRVYYKQDNRKTPYQLRPELLTPQERAALTLHVLAGWPQTRSYAIAFNFKGKAISLPAIASRFFSDPRILDMAKLYANYYGGEPYDINEKYLRMQ